MTDSPLNMSPCHLPAVHTRALAFLEHAIPIGVILLVLLLILGVVYKFKNRAINVSLIVTAIIEAIMAALYFIFFD